ncbi:uroporphyrinogen-III C-methyltransferase [Curtobacterium sp. ISL-83]|uniref:uroporphyrinogen-III C-methyltransferase n=1 Tax=Curtobacterium sp. ISL-83 TaxID=2819145 RepID=UPI001BE6FC06|nr:uroporphyrinogen-III C-methyltransferase [Curtobacterium sp. ISL-83]MBT2501047.1 uroporphyrinogen-III C-methyltransferase [Curtobacterium sp. ISL-83]
MELALDLTGRAVLVVGDADPVRRIVARSAASGAVVDVRTPGVALQWMRAIPVARTPGSVPPAVVVWAADAHPLREAVLAAARALGALVAEERPLAPTPRGHVTLVGGGPGEPDLVTVAGRRALADADVVLHDRLGPRDHVAALAPGATFVDVGKTPGHHAVPQRDIERIMLEHAARGRRVVRLKGGDPFVFGRGGEEVLACRAAGVPITVVPGITSAIAVPAEAGVPVTHREVARAFTVLSGHVPFSEDELRHLVGLGGTIVVLMGIGTVHHTMAGLRRHGMSADVPVVFLERGYTPEQRTVLTTLGGADRAVALEGVRSPAVIVIGEVVRLARDAAAVDGMAADLAQAGVLAQAEVPARVGVSG